MIVKKWRALSDLCWQSSSQTWTETYTKAVNSHYSTYTPCCVFNSPIKSITGSSSDWLKLINMTLIVVEGSLKHLVLQGQSCSKFMFVQTQIKEQLCCAPLGHFSVWPCYLRPQQVLTVKEVGVLFFYETRFAFPVETNMNFWALRKIQADIWLHKQTGIGLWSK